MNATNWTGCERRKRDLDCYQGAWAAKQKVIMSFGSEGTEAAMGYKTILVGLVSPRSAKDLIGIAASLAETFDSHLIGLHVVPDAFIPAAVPIEVTAELLEAQRSANEAQGSQVAAVFADAIRGLRFPTEWRKAEARLESIADVIMRHARAADLVIVGQPDEKLDLIDGIDVSEEVMVGSGRPLLIVPSVGHNGPIGKKVLIAWNNSKESARAVFDAVPFLKKAESVTLLTIKPPRGGEEREGELPAADIAAALARHGISPVVSDATAQPHKVAEEILAQVKSTGADLVVMGGYGHWRLREFVFGGATRKMYDAMTVPVMMSH
jgi:nucleotide-binding universal stress UspA family protein